MARTIPAKHSSADAAEALGAATHRRIEQVGETSPRSLALALNASVPETTRDVLKNPMPYASYNRLRHPETGKHGGGQVNINPNATRDVLAHELGHHITDNTKVGHMIHNLRDNPKLAAALGAAVFGVPLVQSSLQAGDDDAAAGVAIASLLSSPVLINEALATKNGLAIMEDAGMKATAGQRARLAGAYLSYAAAPVIAGLGGNSIGNVLDDHVALYDL